MARFYGGVSGQAKTEATRLGSKKSGLNTFCNGWHCGINVNAFADEDTDADTFDIYATAGSTGDKHSFYLGRVVRNGDKLVFTDCDEFVHEG